jgi:YD repeat-containing protein
LKANADTLGALQLQQESGPLASSAISSAYDELGRIASRTVQGASAETFQYDALGRVTVHTNDLGTFNLGYLGQTNQIASRQLASSTLATTWSYLTSTNDRRLAGIANTGLTAGHFSNFTYATTPENFIAGITETSDATAVYPGAGSQTATYNNLNPLTNLSGQALTFDANGNLTSDGQRTYTWDAENRLVGIGYPGVTGKATAFTYDGLSRRAATAARRRVAAVPRSRRTCGAATPSARRAMPATRRSAATTTRASTYRAHRPRRCTTASTRSARCGARSPALQAHRPMATIPTGRRCRPPRRSLTSSTLACSSMPIAHFISPSIEPTTPSQDVGCRAIP